jgi:hypothetical protein
VLDDEPRFFGVFAFARVQKCTQLEPLVPYESLATSRKCGGVLAVAVEADEVPLRAGSVAGDAGEARPLPFGILRARAH